MRILITGGHGFIGSHVAKALYESNQHSLVRIIDISPKPSMFNDTTIAHESILGSLTDPYTLTVALRDIDTILHFAANMGGMGTIHSTNDITIYTENHAMTLQLLSASIAAGSQVHRIFYASSACVYPEHLQQDSARDVKLGEDDAFAGANAQVPPRPQGLYGLEKLNTELLLNELGKKHEIDVQIARFHNVYGPGGVYNGGREKVPAAFLRKSIALKALMDAGVASANSSAGRDGGLTMEVWGNGRQRRSFLYIDDAVDAVLRFLESGYTLTPLNIGSTESVSIDELAHLSLRCSGISPETVTLRHIEDRPVGVGSRCSNNDRVTTALDWSPITSVEHGMRLTHRWIETEISSGLHALSTQSSEIEMLLRLGTSDVLLLDSETITFAILLPITSRSATLPPDQCIVNLNTFAESLIRTTHKDIRLSRPGSNLDGTRFDFKIYVAVDEDDAYLRETMQPEAVLKGLGLRNIRTLLSRHPRGHVCALWRDCARQAWKDGCDYYVLLGDDVTLLDEHWMSRIHAEFVNISKRSTLPLGVGCVAFTDVSFPGMPTFPVVHRHHMTSFDGMVVPECFVNQDGDPYLFQLYRRLGCSTMISCRVSNSIGGSDNARYEKQHTSKWAFDPLDKAVQQVADIPASFVRPITLDVVIPCYRVQLTLISNIVNLTPPPGLSVMFIIIVDNPLSDDTVLLERLFGHRVDVRIRVNASNMGASASRNRGMIEESSAEWVHFLDDDIVPSPNLLVEDEMIIRAHPDAAGFVGNCQFPPAATIFQAAVHLASVTYFWDIAKKIDSDVPWGVTANLLARRNNDDVKFDLRYPKTGGGEDIDFCVLKRRAAVRDRGSDGVFQPAPNVVVTHPWWNEGQRSYWRFFKWAHGDGQLVTRFPEHSYVDYAPNSAELLAFNLIILIVALPEPTGRRSQVCLFVARMVPGIIVVNVLHDWWRHLWRHPERDVELNSRIRSGPAFFAALVESTLIRMFSEMGRLKGVVDRRDWMAVGRRFDWFIGRYGDGPKDEERRNNLERFALLLVWLCVISYF